MAPVKRQANLAEVVIKLVVFLWFNGQEKVWQPIEVEKGDQYRHFLNQLNEQGATVFLGNILATIALCVETLHPPFSSWYG